MIDWNQVRDLRDEVGAEDFDEVVELFLLEVDEEMNALQTCARDTVLAEKLHFLKGSALNLGFDAFSALCQEGEGRLSRDGSASVDLSAMTTVYRASRALFLEDMGREITG